MNVYRLIPFKNISSKTLSINAFIGDLIEKQLTSGNKLLIQDSEDMKIEAFTKDDLQGYIDNYGITIEGLSPTHNKNGLSYGEIPSWLSQEYFLNSDLYVHVYTCENADLDPSIDTEIGISILTLTYLGKVFVLKIEETTTEFVVSINDKYFCTFPDTAFPSMVYIEYILRLVQICKVKDGFELVVSFPDDKHFFGIKVSNDMQLMYMTNIKDFIGKPSDEFKSVIELSLKK